LNGNAKLLEIINSAKGISNIPFQAWGTKEKKYRFIAKNKVKTG
jgi:hypothetical protein